jgi:biotin carboxyl carrier protein
MKMADIEVCSEITGTVWKILVKVGDKVEEDDTLAILESMKMEIPLDATADGVVSEIRIAEGQQISAGMVACVIKE